MKMGIKMVAASVLLLFSAVLDISADYVEEYGTAILHCPLVGNFTYPKWTGFERYTNPLTNGEAINEPDMQWADSFKKDIKIMNVTSKHDGTYTCEDDTGFKSAKIYLNVKYFRDNSMYLAPAVSTKERNSTTLSCSIYSNPDAIIDVQTNSSSPVELTESIRCDLVNHPEDNTHRCTKYVTFTATKEDNGKVQSCKFSSRDGKNSITTTTTLKFEFPPTSIKINGNKPIRTGSFLDLTCSTDSSNPVSSIDWYNGPEKQPFENRRIDVDVNPIITDAEFNGKSVTDSIRIGVSNAKNGYFVSCCARDLCDTVQLDINIASTGAIMTTGVSLMIACAVFKIGFTFA